VHGASGFDMVTSRAPLPRRPWRARPLSTPQGFRPCRS
jgi:hypothetical protein